MEFVGEGSGVGGDITFLQFAVASSSGGCGAVQSNISERESMIWIFPPVVSMCRSVGTVFLKVSVRKFENVVMYTTRNSRTAWV